ncbi:MAG: OsmC family protein [Planctomycetota bacterium]
MAVEIRLRYDGNTAVTATHGPSGSMLRTVAPTDNGGDGSSFSPTDLLATGLASCLLTIMGMKAAKLGVDISGASARIEKHMSTEPPRRVARLPLTVSIPVEPDEALRTEIETAGRNCPVCKSLSEQVKVELQIEWGAHAPAAS